MSPSASHAGSGEPMWLQRLNKMNHGRFIVGTLIGATVFCAGLVTLQYSRGIDDKYNLPLL